MFKIIKKKGLNSLTKKEIWRYFGNQLEAIGQNPEWLTVRTPERKKKDCIKIKKKMNQFIFFGLLEKHKFPCPLIKASDVKKLNASEYTSNVCILAFAKKKSEEDMTVTVITSFWGDVSPAIPGNAKESEESVSFWKKHCLVVHNYNKVERREKPDWF